MTIITVASGSKWGSAELDDWGDVSPSTQIELSRLTVARFEELAETNGWSVTWTPSTSEVLGDQSLDLGDGPNLLNGLREQAIEEVWEGLVHGTGPMADAVQQEIGESVI